MPWWARAFQNSPLATARWAPTASPCATGPCSGPPHVQRVHGSGGQAPDGGDGVPVGLPAGPVGRGGGEVGLGGGAGVHGEVGRVPVVPGLREPGQGLAGVHGVRIGGGQHAARVDGEAAAVGGGVEPGQGRLGVDMRAGLRQEQLAAGEGVEVPRPVPARLGPVQLALDGTRRRPPIHTGQPNGAPAGRSRPIPSSRRPGRRRPSAPRARSRCAVPARTDRRRPPLAVRVAALLSDR